MDYQSESGETGAYTAPIGENIDSLMQEMGRRARRALVHSYDNETRKKMLHEATRFLIEDRAEILASNQQDIDKAKGMKPSLCDRLALDEGRLYAMAKALTDIASMKDPLGDVLWRNTHANGMEITRVTVPIGVLGMIYEARPNVTSDAAGLAIKSGNAIILRCGSSMMRSAQAVINAIRKGIESAACDPNLVQLVGTTDRAAVGVLLRTVGLTDLIVPRGGRGLVERVMKEACVPVLAHLEGLCHIYIDSMAECEKAVSITANAKMRRTGVCGAVETLLVHESVKESILPPLLKALSQRGCEIRGDAELCRIFPEAKRAKEDDWHTEYLDAILSIKIVPHIDAAIAHINHYGSHHTEVIITEDLKKADHFLACIDSAIVGHNVSTQFADGGEFGLGAEIGIATGKLHARGPVGARELTSYKYLIRGTGQCRP